MFNYNVASWLKPFLGIIDGIGTLIFFNSKGKKFPKDVKKILVIRVEHIGDVLLTTPTFRALKEKYPKAQIDVLVRSFSKQVLENNKNANPIVFNPPWLSMKGSISEVLKMIPRLKNKYDVVIDMHGDPRNIIFSKLVGGYSIGYGIRGFGFLLNKTVKYDKRLKHTIERNLDVVRSIGADTKNKNMEFNLTKKDILFANKIKNAVCINAGAARERKLWDNEKWAKVADSISKKYKIIFTGSSSEKKSINEIIKHMKSTNYLNLCGKTNLTQLGAVIKKCKLFIGADSGPMHIAKAVNTKIVAIFGTEDPRQWGYSDKSATYIKRSNLQKLKAEEVIKVVKRMLR